MELNIKLTVDQVVSITLETLIDSFDDPDLNDVEVVGALAKVIKYYSNKRQWEQFCKKRGMDS